MIVATPLPHGVFFQPPPTRRGFARIINAGTRARDVVSTNLRQLRGNSRKPAKKIQNQPLRREQASRRARLNPKPRATFNVRSVADGLIRLLRLDRSGIDIHLVNDHVHSRQSRNHSRLPRDYHALSTASIVTNATVVQSCPRSRSSSTAARHQPPGTRLQPVHPSRAEENRWAQYTL